MTNYEKIKACVEQARKFPKASIEYSFEELPEHKEITADSFFGVKATFNKNVPTNTGCTTIYSY